jgi:hypothetical protein
LSGIGSNIIVVLSRQHHQLRRSHRHAHDNVNFDLSPVWRGSWASPRSLNPRRLDRSASSTIRRLAPKLHGATEGGYSPSGARLPAGHRPIWTERNLAPEELRFSGFPALGRVVEIHPGGIGRAIATPSAVRDPDSKALSAIALHCPARTSRADCAGKPARPCRHTHRDVARHGLEAPLHRAIQGNYAPPARFPANGCKRSRCFGPMWGWSRASADSNVRNRCGAQRADCDTTSNDQRAGRTIPHPNS